jgi:Cys-tRNA(Pro)/Cys-tRNA(Cys) deacylase
MKTTNVTRFLDARNVKYTVKELPERKFGAAETAQFLGIPEDEVYKTIVTMGKDSGRTVLVLVGGDTEVDLKALANLLGEKKVLKLSQR